jgi:hypothetical protein
MLKLSKTQILMLSILVGLRYHVEAAFAYCPLYDRAEYKYTQDLNNVAK